MLAKYVDREPSSGHASFASNRRAKLGRTGEGARPHTVIANS